METITKSYHIIADTKVFTSCEDVTVNFTKKEYEDIDVRETIIKAIENDIIKDMQKSNLRV